MDQAVGAALAGDEPVMPATHAVPALARSPLTAREQEVAAFIVHGLHTRQIAAELSISPNTVDRHVENIFNKLNLTSRTQIAAWAVAHGYVSLSELEPARDGYG
jgi:DNA-binding NarL/FixJ family response regulator